MIKLKMHAMYDHFPDRSPAAGEPYIDCYSDTYVKECTAPGKNIALLLEPRSMIGEAYEYVFEHETYFKYIFTHDSDLLTLPQARLFTWGNVWLQTDSEKTKGISLCTSYKNWCPLHNARLELANFYKDRPEVDVFFGDWNNTNIPQVEAADYLEHYKFSIVIENDIDDFWYTEKILNCFATKTVPIYLGSPMIGKLFDGRGILQVEDWQEVKDVVEHIKDNLDWNYRLFEEYIDNNYKLIEPFKIQWKDKFFRDYGELLEDLQNE